jgi:hypothetical protein
MVIFHSYVNVYQRLNMFSQFSSPQKMMVDHDLPFLNTISIYILGPVVFTFLLTKYPTSGDISHCIPNGLQSYHHEISISQYIQCLW